MALSVDMPSHEQVERSSPKQSWTQSRKYQIAGFICFVFILGVACVGTLASNSLQHVLGIEGDDDNGSSKSLSSSATSTTLDILKTTLSPTSVSPTNTPSTLPSHLPSLQPTVADSNHPSLTPTMPLPTYSQPPSVLPSMVPSTSMEPSTHFPDVFGIYIMGDVPYASWEELILQLQLTSLNDYTHPTAQFMVHVGDIQKPQRTMCVESRYAMVSTMMKKAPLPTLVLAGDNDWIDCPMPLVALSNYHKYFDFFHLNWNATTVATNVTNLSIVAPEPTEAPQNFQDMNTKLNFEHHPKYPEMWRIYLNGILLLSVQNVDYKGLIQSAPNRTHASIQWVRSSIHSSKVIQAVIIFGHGQFAENTKPFFEGIYKAFTNAGRLGTTVMYIHGDGHKWDLGDKVQSHLGWSSFVDVQVDQGAFADPLLMQFSMRSPFEVEHDLQYLFANRTIRIDRQRGRYPLEDGRPNILKLFPSQLNNR